MVTPSGKVKVHCVAAAAIKGIENAVDHSAATIVPAACPCFGPADVDPQENPQCVEIQAGKCLDDFYWRCSNDTTSFRLSLNRDAYGTPVCAPMYTCGSGGMTQSIPITAEEFDACFALVEPLLPLPPVKE